MRALQPGTTTLQPDPRAEGPSCGLVPLAGPARVTTAGLKWNLLDDEISFGRFISTSNQLAVEVRDANDGVVEYDATEVVITTDTPLVWTTDISRLR